MLLSSFWRAVRIRVCRIVLIALLARGLLRTPNEVSSVSHWRNVDPQKRVGQCTGF